MKNELDLILEDNGELLDSNSLELVGHWYEQDGVKYMIPLIPVTDQYKLTSVQQISTKSNKGKESKGKESK